MGAEDLKKVMIEIKNRAEADPTLDVSDVVALVEEFYTENQKKNFGKAQ